MSLSGNPWWLVGPRLIDTGCLLVDLVLGLFCDDWKIPDLHWSVDLFWCAHFGFVDSPFLLERKWYCLNKIIVLFCSTGFLFSRVEWLSNYLPFTWSRLFHIFQVSSCPSLVCLDKLVCSFLINALSAFSFMGPFEGYFTAFIWENINQIRFTLTNGLTVVYQFKGIANFLTTLKMFELKAT